MIYTSRSPRLGLRRSINLGNASHLGCVRKRLARRNEPSGLDGSVAPSGILVALPTQSQGDSLRAFEFHRAMKSLVFRSKPCLRRERKTVCFYEGTIKINSDPDGTDLYACVRLRLLPEEDQKRCAQGMSPCSKAYGVAVEVRECRRKPWHRWAISSHSLSASWRSKAPGISIGSNREGLIVWSRSLIECPRNYPAMAR